jgi:signal recognition particle subunit SRP54
MFDQLTARLTEAIQRVTGRGRITEENIRDTVRTIRMALLEADEQPKALRNKHNSIQIEQTHSRRGQ